MKKLQLFLVVAFAFSAVSCCGPHWHHHHSHAYNGGHYQSYAAYPSFSGPSMGYAAGPHHHHRR